MIHPEKKLNLFRVIFLCMIICYLQCTIVAILVWFHSVIFRFNLIHRCVCKYFKQIRWIFLKNSAPDLNNTWHALHICKKVFNWILICLMMVLILWHTSKNCWVREEKCDIILIQSINGWLFITIRLTLTLQQIVLASGAFNQRMTQQHQDLRHDSWKFNY